MTEPTRPALRYHGGKWRLAPWIVSYFPPHRVYVEPFAGAASVLLRKQRAYAEILNDLDGEVVSLFRVLRDPKSGAELQRLVALTPYARDEFDRAYEKTEDPLELARRLLVRSFMGHGSSGVRAHRTGFRVGAMREGSTPSHDWAGFPAAMPALVARLQGVVIENRDALSVIERQNRPETLVYADPPYLFATRSQKRVRGDLYHGYRHELDDAGHAALLAALVDFKGMVVLSGYRSSIYDQMLPGWRNVECPTFADGGAQRIEVLWINPAAAAALDRHSAPLFSEVA